MKRLLFLAVLVFGFGLLYSQSTVTGKVTDARSGDPLEGVAVVVKGTTIGAFTNDQGSYSLEVPSDGQFLIFSFVGRATQEIKIDGRSSINISLAEDLTLDEVVVTALGVTKKKKALGYSVQEVGGDVIANSKETNVATALAGKVAGVQAFSVSGAPGAGANIRIRGSASISGNNQPLFVVDGIPVSNNQERSESGLRGAVVSNRALDINPDDIESVSVLKGAAASVLYGSRAANGVILITTKKGARNGGGMSINYSGSLAFDEVNKLPELQSTFAQGLNGTSSANIRSWGAKISETLVDPASGLPVPAGTAGATAAQVYNNNDEFFTTGTTLRNNISLSGGDVNRSFYASFGDTRQEGVIPGTEYTRSNVSLRGNTKLGNKLRVAGSVNYTKSNSRRAQQGSNGGGVALALFRTPASYRASNGATEFGDASSYLNADGSQRNWHPAFNNPYWTINRDPFTDDVNRVFGHVEWEYSPVSWLSVMHRLGNDYYTDARQQIFAIGSANGGRVGQVFEDIWSRRETYSDFFVNFKPEIEGKFGATLMVGNNLSHRTRKNLYVQGAGLTIDNFYNLGNASNITTFDYDEIIRTAAVFADAQFEWDNWIFLGLTGRNEWASTFGQEAETQSFFYPAANLGVVFTEALGLESSTGFPYGKLRVSYGEVGNQPPVYSTSTVFVGPSITDGYTRAQGVSSPFAGQSLFGQSTQLGNAQLRPERVRSFEIGVDLKFLSNRVGLDVTYFNQLSIDQIFAVPVARTAGYTSTVLNAGEISNKGWEAILKLQPVVNPEGFNWEVSANFTTYKNVVEKLADGVENIGLGGFFGANGRLVAGQTFGLLYGDTWNRTDDGQLIIEQNPDSPEYGFPLTDYGEDVVGDPNPDFLLGIRNTFTFKGLRLEAFLDIKEGGDMWNGTRGALYSYGTHAGTEGRGVETKVFEGVTGTRNADNEIVVQGDGAANAVQVTLDESWFRTGNGSGFVGPSEQFVEDASWVRLRELTLAYTLPSSLLGKTPFRRIEVGVTGRNLWLSTPYTGIDPETSLSGSGNLQGLDYFQMPNTRSINFNLNLGF
ncbi:MAG: SusC/RagA family TonB-linked outer membrane protein [Bacteroidia bacterium]